MYEPVSRQRNRSWRDDTHRSATLLRHLGGRRAVELTAHVVDVYRERRRKEHTRYKRPPAPATLDREVELLKRLVSYGVSAGVLDSNPLSGVRLLRQPNTRLAVIGEDEFGKLVAAADPPLRPILLVAFDTGMRKREILDLRWTRVDLSHGVIRLAAQDTKTAASRLIVLTRRVRQVMGAIPRHLHSEFVFVNPRTGRPWSNIDKMFPRARKEAGLDTLWFHDLRRSFVTRARRAGIPESVVMRMSGHKTRAVFDRYNIVNEEDLRAAVDKLDEQSKSLINLGQDLDTFGI